MVPCYDFRTICLSGSRKFLATLKLHVRMSTIINEAVTKKPHIQFLKRSKDYPTNVRITILNGNPNVEDSGFDDYLTKLETELESSDHTVKNLQLRDMDIRYCIGCFYKEKDGSMANRRFSARTKIPSNMFSERLGKNNKGNTQRYKIKCHKSITTRLLDRV